MASNDRASHQPKTYDCELKRIEEDCTHSGKSHFNAADRWTTINYLIGIPAMAVSLIAGAAYVKNYESLAGLLSISAAVLTGLMTFVKPSEKSAKHKSAGDQYLSLRNDCRVYREIQLPITSKPQSIVDAISGLSKRRNEINQASPQFARWDFEKARKGIDAGETTHAIDKEKS